MKLTLEDTKKIAQLMGYEIIVYKGLATYNGNSLAKNVGQLRDLWEGLDLEFTGRHCKDVYYPFDKDWNYIMPIITRIESLGFDVKVSSHYTIIQSIEKTVTVGGGTKKENACKAILEFADWYLAKG